MCVRSLVRSCVPARKLGPFARLCLHAGRACVCGAGTLRPQTLSELVADKAAAVEVENFDL